MNWKNFAEGSLRIFAALLLFGAISLGLFKTSDFRFYLYITLISTFLFELMYRLFTPKRR